MIESASSQVKGREKDANIERVLTLLLRHWIQHHERHLTGRVRQMTALPRLEIPHALGLTSKCSFGMWTLVACQLLVESS